MLKRRPVVTMASIATLVCAATGRFAIADNGEIPDFDSPTLPDLEELGTQPATTHEVQVSLSVLAGCPMSSPLAAMTYFSRLTVKNTDNELYNAGWKNRWNPVIVAFFKGTKCTPSGDVTPWCAASMNWILGRCGLKGTANASSSSFRDAPGKTNQPKTGDIVVFRSADHHQARLGHGHVSLFVSQTAESVICLGGNQVRAGHHAIMQQTISKNGFLTLDSFHSIEAFRRA